MNDDLIVLISMLVTYFLLILCAAPLSIHNVLILVSARCKGIRCQSVLKNVASRMHTLHLDPLLPITEGPNYLHFVAALAPCKHMLGWRWGHWLWSHNLLLLLLSLGHCRIDHLLLMLLGGRCCVDHLLLCGMKHTLLIYSSLMLLMSLLLVWKEALWS